MSTRQATARMLRAAGLGFAVAAIAAAPASAGTRWVIKGHGLGHGVGMSQYGARGLAEHGRSHGAILRHYYRGTQIDRTAGRRLRVLLDQGQAKVGFTRAEKACGRDLNAGRSYHFDREGLDVILRNQSDHKLKNCGREGKAHGGGTVKIEGEGVYRGNLIARAEKGGLMEINSVGLEAYLKGVVANEMPASWPGRALRAQAIAARSYALATVKSGVFDHFDDARSQVYRGKASETRSTNRAVAKTRREVVKHGGEIATTYFFSTSGGKTENVEYGFLGSNPLPYLESVNDPYDDISPYHRWRVRLSQSKMESRLSSFFSGRLRKIEVTKRGVSPRIVRARVVGSKSSSKVTGPQLRSALSLNSTWARFEKRRR